jgi:hypothetical protein
MAMRVKSAALALVLLHSGCALAPSQNVIPRAVAVMTTSPNIAQKVNVLHRIASGKRL